MIGFIRSKPCPNCNSEMAIPTELFEAALHDPSIKFYCSYGHVCCFSKESAQAYLKERVNAQNNAQDGIAANTQQSLIKIEGNVIPFPRKENNIGNETQGQTDS